ncbi:MAG: DUF721 domain-containing protein [Actinomycetota bacterium]|nr:DUF721 domain-containing protein [Actinomycetota bacterium]
MSEDEPRRLDASLDRLLAGLGAPPAEAVGDVFERWGDIVGPGVAERTRPVRVDGGRLVVEAEDAAWASQLRWSSRSIIEACRRELGVDVGRIEVRVRSG